MDMRITMIQRVVQDTLHGGRRPFKEKLHRKEVSQLANLPKVGGPGHGRSRPFTSDTVLSNEDVEAAIAVLRHSADEDTIREKMKVTFMYRHSIVKDEKKAADVFSVFPRFLDTPGLIEQDFRHLFGEVCQQILGEVAHLSQSKSFKGKPWTGAHHRALAINVQC